MNDSKILQSEAYRFLKTNEHLGKYVILLGDYIGDILKAEDRL